MSHLLNKFLSNASENEALFNNTKGLLLRALACNDSKEMFVESQSYFLNIEGIDFAAVNSSMQRTNQSLRMPWRGSSKRKYLYW